MSHWPVRFVVVLVGIILFDGTIRYVCTHLLMKVFFYDVKDSNFLLAYCQFLYWFFRGYFILVFMARKLPRPAVVLLLTASCLFYAPFLMAHFPGFYEHLWNYRGFIPGALVFILAELPRSIKYGSPHMFIHVSIHSPAPLLFLIFLLSRHIVSILCIAFLYELAFGADRIGRKR
jgi:hypothetical protein